ncbi:hypothetical protein GCM10009765_01050 [Fodinicola feengrottensis]|uniref:Uncharacterized protein n=1 Tax=Fodinicola feengrottensis TaxID=435914 RepID=A0ABN2FPI9_9ACTN
MASTRAAPPAPATPPVTSAATTAAMAIIGHRFRRPPDASTVTCWYGPGAPGGALNDPSGGIGGTPPEDVPAKGGT